MNEQNEHPQADTKPCGPGCQCGKKGFGARTKWMMCGVVLVAAVVAVAAHVSRTRAAEGEAKSRNHAVTIPLTDGVAPSPPAPAASKEEWAPPLNALTDLNQVAADTEGVFIVVPSSDQMRTAAVQKEVAAAASTLAAGGTPMGRFILSRDSQEYAELAQQVGAPAVLALCKGRGMAAVQDDQVTQDSLLKAFAAASRPSGCGSSGCGSGAAGCN